MAGNDEGTGWRLVPRLLLRRAGFGVDTLEAFTDPAVLKTSEEFRSAVAALELAREALLRTAVPQAVSRAREAGDRPQLRALSGLRSAVGRRRELPAAGSATALREPLSAALTTGLSRYRLALATCGECEQALRDAIREGQADRARRARKEITPRMLDAVLQLAPSFHEGLLRWLATADSTAATADGPAAHGTAAESSAAGTGGGAGAGTARERAMLRRIYLFQQRLAAKNESTSFFGPLVHGVVDREIDGVQLGPETESGILATQPFLAFWAVTALARAMAADPRVGPHVPVSWVPVNRLDADRLTLADGRVVELSEPQAALAATIDGDRSATELARAADLPLARIEALLTQFERLGVVRTWPEPPSVVSQPFEVLLADARRWAAGTEWPQQLEALWKRAEAFAAVEGHEERRTALEELEASFTELAGTAARRAGGKVYADRMVSFLESHGDQGPLRLGRDLAVQIERELGPVFNVGARYGELVRESYQELAGQVLREAGASRMPYDTFVRRMQAVVAQRPPERWDQLAGCGELTARLTDLVQDRLTGWVSRLTAADLAGLAGPPQGARFASPDVLFRQVQQDGPLELVLGEVHPYVFAWGSQRHFCPDPEGLDADFAAELACWGGPEAIATLIPRRRHKGLIAEAFPGRFVELSGVATRDRRRVVPITELTVELVASEAGDRVLLLDHRGEVVLYAGQDDHPHLLAFAPPATPGLPLIRLGDTAPRIVAGSLIIQRAGWWVPPAELLGTGDCRGGPEGDAEGFCAVQRARSLRQLPRWVFAHLPGEPKPVCVDLDSPMAVDTLLAAVRERPEAPVPLREMVPEPEELWLRRQGRLYTSELRLAMVGGVR